MPNFQTNQFRLGPPTSGVWAVGDQSVDANSVLWVCTVAGTGTSAAWISNQRSNVPTGTGDLSLQSLTGNVGQVANASFPVRSNLEWNIYSGPMVDTATLATSSGVMIAVPVPVDVGMTVTNISVLIGATAASTPTHSFAALYSGTTVASPPLIAQSTDGGTAAIAASARFDFALTTPQVITAAQAPNGYVWAAVAVTATTTVPSCVTMPCGAAATQYRWFSNSPLYFSQTSGSGVGGTAPATLINASTKTVAPIVYLW